MDRPAVNRYKLSVESYRVRCASGLNDVPIAVDADAAGLKYNGVVNQWVMPAGNRLTVRLEWPDGVAYEPGVASHVSAIFLVTPAQQARQTAGPSVGQQSDQTIVDGGAAPALARVVWPPPPGDRRREGYPYRATLPFEVLQPPPPTRLWLDADELREVGPPERAGLLEVARAFHGAMGRRDVDAAAALMRFRQTELALAYGADVDADLAENREFLAELFAAPGFALLPLDESTVETAIVGANRVVLTTRAGGQDLIRTVDMPRFRYRLPVYFARIDGKWVIAR